MWPRTSTSSTTPAGMAGGFGSGCESGACRFCGWVIVAIPPRLTARDARQSSYPAGIIIGDYEGGAPGHESDDGPSGRKNDRMLVVPLATRATGAVRQRGAQD